MAPKPRWQWWGHRSRLSLNRSQQALIWLGALVLGVRLMPYFDPIGPEEVAQESQAYQFSDRHGLPLGTILSHHQEHTATVELSEISPYFIQGILAAEDQDFYHHGVVDLQAAARAVLQALNHGKVVSGASTVTMQLARMVAPTPRTLGGKVGEIWHGWRLAAGLSKDEILRAYINRLPMGSNIYGVEAAAQIYFGVAAQDLTLPQASVLAALPNNPVYLNPYEYWEPLKVRQRYVLDRMVANGYITEAQAHQAAVAPIALKPRQQGLETASHFLFWLRSQLSPQAPSSIRTTIDRPLQTFVQSQVRQQLAGLAAKNVHQAAAIVIDNHNGEVLAYVGSPDYFHPSQGSNDGVQALRQPGSTLKPFLYRLALALGTIRPQTILADVPTHYALPEARLYSPKDYSETYVGPVRVRLALANSLNIPAVRVLSDLGVALFLQELRSLGFTDLRENADFYGLGLTLGSGEVTLWQLAQAYVTLARQGDRQPLTMVINPEHQRFPDPWPPSPLPTTDPRSWQLITDFLQDSPARAQSFGVDSVLNLPFPVAVKTGTSSHYRDTWTVGYSQDYTVATWVGNFDGTPMESVSGVAGAAPLWQGIMLHLHRDRPVSPFPEPQGLVKRPICSLSGAKPSPPCPAIAQEYFYPEDLPAYDHTPDPFYEKILLPSGTSEYRLNLPPEYDDWLATQPPTFQSKSNLRIVFPAENEVLFLAPNPPTHQRRVAFQGAGIQGKPTEWWLNGKKLATQTENNFFWTLQPGHWQLELRQGSTVVTRHFQVQSTPPSPMPSGFSF